MEVLEWLENTSTIISLVPTSTLTRLGFKIKLPRISAINSAINTFFVTSARTMAARDGKIL